MNLNRTEELEIKKDIKGIRKSIEKLADYFGPPAPPEDKISDPSVDPFFGKIHMSEAHRDAYTTEFETSFIQMIVLMEECAELQQILSKSIRHTTYLDTRCGSDRANLIEEIAHVMTSIRMVCDEFDITPEEIQQEIYKKYPDGYDVTILFAENKPYYMERTKGSE